MNSASRITVNPDANGNGHSVFVMGETVKRWDTGESYEGVKIVTAQGIAHMTVSQWRSMLALGLSMQMQELTNEN